MFCFLSNSKSFKSQSCQTLSENTTWKQQTEYEWNIYISLSAGKHHWICFDVHAVENLSLEMLWCAQQRNNLPFLPLCLFVCLAACRRVQFQQRRGSRWWRVQSDLSDPVQEWGGDPGGPHELQIAPAAGRGEGECPAALTTEETNTCEASG